jgi:hypothetical protein
MKGRHRTHVGWVTLVYIENTAEDPSDHDDIACVAQPREAK